ncbi:GAF domain-containing protein [Paenibacillus sp. NPDC055715]
MHPHTVDLDVTKNIGNHSFTGIPIRMKNGQVYGTICILDAPSVQLTETELKALHAMAGFAHIWPKRVTKTRDGYRHGFSCC